jgi:protein-S-isoprenylcysteine O-methyltransferase Ste14
VSNRRDTAGVIAPPPLLALLALVLGVVLDRLFPVSVLSLLLSLPERIVIGAVVIGAGIALAVPALLAFRKAQTHVEPWKPSLVLVTESVYQWLRNPMYVGATLLLAGLAIVLASDWTLVMTIAFAMVVHFGVVKREERYLETKFGEAYRAYRERVRRYGRLPF